MVGGVHGDALKLRIAAPPVAGAANAELTRFLAELFGVPRSGVEVVAGGASRRKLAVVRGVSLPIAERKLELALKERG